MLRRAPKDWPRRGATLPRPNPAVRAVVDDLEAGSLESFADHIRDQNGQIDRQVALALYDLIRGNKDCIGHRLTTVFHPDRSPNETSVSDVAAAHQRLAIAVNHYWRIKGDRLQKAVAFEVATKFGISQRRLLHGLSLYRHSPWFAKLCDFMDNMRNG